MEGLLAFKNRRHVSPQSLTLMCPLAWHTDKPHLFKMMIKRKDSYHTRSLHDPPTRTIHEQPLLIMDEAPKYDLRGPLDRFLNVHHRWDATCP
jgi:hypothetical protein